ncbi:MAG: hypothetical protein LBJ31_04710 [Treponema sp.]|jgi:hypothetical protein|nr:hypothetical protein [Treponema sp.]
MNRFCFAVVAVVVVAAALVTVGAGALLASCTGGADPVKQTSPANPVRTNPDADDPAFDRGSISKEEFDTAKSEVQALILRLNGIIRARDYDAWVSYLTDDYLRVISSPENLEAVSKNSERLVQQGKVLTSSQEYFTFVVVPSRANDRVDDIQFRGKNRVTAYTIVGGGRRLRLYDLERTREGWKILRP